jgi:hypothetical protein
MLTFESFEKHCANKLIVTCVILGAVFTLVMFLCGFVLAGRFFKQHVVVFFRSKTGGGGNGLDRHEVVYAKADKKELITV